MKRIALINQRYGLEINGGSELYTRQIAERLVPHYDVHVLTTCALEYTTWENHYKPGVENINGVTVHRFKTAHPRVTSRFNSLNERIWSGEKSDDLVEKWVDEMGPYCPDIVKYCEEHCREYDAFIVVTYLYYTAVRCMPKIAEKAIFIPTAHQEPFIDLNIYKSVFESCRAYIFLTDEERELVSRKFNISGKPYEVTGAGVDVPPDISSEAFREKYGIYDDYIIYVGRIDEGKNCPEFFDQFIKYKKRNAGGLKLVLMGKAVVPVPEHKDIINLGFVSDEDKFNGISGAKLLVLPSRFESLSISVLEAMTLSVPVLVNGACNVLKGHCTKSNGGLYYTNYFELEGALNYIFSHPEEYGIMCRNARRYVDDNYQWNVILDKICSVIEKTSGC